MLTPLCNPSSDFLEKNNTCVINVVVHFRMVNLEAPK